tara:strand:+ start:520 stop:825 length:306 start_codon:yes stop_codon:yes gene_type:complete
MPLYEADGKKQKPIVRKGTGFYSHATTPTAQTVVKRPSYVLVNRAGSYLFAYESGSYPSEYISGSVHVGSGGPVRLDISPVAWGSATQAVGDVTFVYVRVS